MIWVNQVVQGVLLGGYYAFNASARQFGIFDSVTKVREFHEFMDEQPFTLRIEGEF